MGTRPTASELAEVGYTHPLIADINSGNDALASLGGRGLQATNSVLLAALIGLELVGELVGITLTSGHAFDISGLITGFTLRLVLFVEARRATQTKPFVITAGDGHGLLAYFVTLGVSVCPYLAFAYGHTIILGIHLVSWLPVASGLAIGCICGLLFLVRQRRLGGGHPDTHHHVSVAAVLTGVASFVTAQVQGAPFLNSVAMGSFGSSVAFLVAFVPFSVMPLLHRGLSDTYRCLFSYVIFSCTLFITFQVVNVVKHSDRILTRKSGLGFLCIGIARFCSDTLLALVSLRTFFRVRDSLRSKVATSTLQQSLHIANAYHETLLLLGALFLQAVTFIGYGCTTYFGPRQESPQVSELGLVVVMCVVSSLPLLAIMRNELPTWMRCKNFRAAQVFIQEIGVHARAMRPHFFQCYCSHCCTVPDFLSRAGVSPPRVEASGVPPRQHAVPYGWARFALHCIPPGNTSDFWTSWNRCYHGTTVSALLGIIAHHQLLIPGDTLLDGTVLPIRDNHLVDRNQVYTSPSLRYASLDCYATPVLCLGGKWQIVLECRQHPASFQEQPHTVQADFRDPSFDNATLEWVTVRRMAVVPTAALVRRLHIPQ